ncbi:methyl-accepting chemotaxis protein [Pseudobacillus sp. FSL P4-0506]|uniref:HAMP domain-containing methyl-accepting chemotaxis protein n=1 Tax=unclassified Pseudobacillus TaxID=2619284 RepID=UPI0030F7874D
MVSKLLKNLSIGKKYGLALGVVILLFCLSAIVVYVKLVDVKENIAALEQKGDRAIKMTKMASLFSEQDIRIADYINHPDERFVKGFEERKQAFTKLEKELEAAIKTEKEEEVFAWIKGNNKEVSKVFHDKVIPAVKSGDELETLLARQRTQALRSETVEKLAELESMINEQRKLASNEAKHSLNESITVLIFSIILSAAIGSAAVFMINRLVRHHLNRVVEMADSISEGNLQIKKSNYEGEDEIAQLSSAMNQMLESLQDIIQKITVTSEIVTSQSGELTEAASEVKAGSQQAAATMQQLSAGAESQAHEVNDLSEVMASYIERVQEANSSGEHIYIASKAVSELTTEGKRLMSSSVNQMREIDKIMQASVERVRGLDRQSQEISSLVAVIQAIAEQTNLLALNAAIEAARAGEHGKGFAVVAAEVRKLAVQVSHSVKDITAIVSDVQQESSEVAHSLEAGYIEVGKGMGQIQTTGAMFEKIDASISEMTERVQFVSKNLNQIVTGSEQMNRSIENIASVSEESAAGVEQTSASIQQTSSSMEEIAENAVKLSKLAEDLNGLVCKFTV